MKMNRREFLATAAAFCTTAATAAPEGKPVLRRAMIVGEPTEKALRPLKEAGFDGVETSALADPEKAASGRKLAESMGLRIHSVLRGWAEFNSDDPAKVAATLATTECALRAAQAYGADAVLLVPCRIGGMPMPDPWDFSIAFDEKTGHVLRVVEGDNAKYAKYIEAHNHAVDTSREAVKKLIPVAEETKVVIALENVWNNLWVQPGLYRHFVASFQSEWVRAYFDIGNHVKYRPSHEWIRSLGPLIAKCHIKDFKLNPDGRGGRFVHPREGDVNWPEVRKALEETGYNGWLTIEDGGLSLPDFRARLDAIIAGT